ncbi:hypothetical protein AQ490_21710 [Wenjunlia vitaminophila]|uniref:Methylamine utilisation protein MauE domain-containing protein n=2 Tax=Wenjunlia vitaminophila TaxID=76728 RepID=A0A0T6LSP5_WENVI|nr:hypothetical protein AQ490_21710 [Wenjunlia vitaminophila]
MLSLSSHLAPLALGALLGWTGATKLCGRSARRQAAGTALERITGGLDPATRALRAVGAIELLVAVALLAVPSGTGPAGVWPGAAAALLGAGFLGYLGYARVTMPESSCGCTARQDVPIGWQAFSRAGLVAVGGAAAAGSATPWWDEIADHPRGGAVWLAGFAVLTALLFLDLEQKVLLPVRRLRLRVLGHPLDGDATTVPVEASVELLERSLAWEAASPVIRSGLLDHWDEDGWRFLQYSGSYPTERGPRPGWVLFALDGRAHLDNSPRPAVRVTVLDQETQQPVPGALADVTSRPQLPIVTGSGPA